jgi:hypothetical protein
MGAALSPGFGVGCDAVAFAGVGVGAVWAESVVLFLSPSHAAIRIRAKNVVNVESRIVNLCRDLIAFFELARALVSNHLRMGGAGQFFSRSLSARYTQSVPFDLCFPAKRFVPDSATCGPV